MELFRVLFVRTERSSCLITFASRQVGEAGTLHEEGLELSRGVLKLTHSFLQRSFLSALRHFPGKTATIKSVFLYLPIGCRQL